MAAAEETLQLHPDPLRGDLTQIGGPVYHGSLGLRLHGKSQPGGEAEAPEDPQGVLPEAGLRRAHRPQDPGGQIRPAPPGVREAPPQVHGHGIDGEVPAGQILRQGTGELHPFRVAVVQIVPIPAEGGDLYPPAAAHGDSAVLQPCGQGAGSEQLQHRLRQGVGGHVPVPRRTSQQQVPHRAAHAPCLVPRRLQPGHHILHFLWDLRHQTARLS